MTAGPLLRTERFGLWQPQASDLDQLVTLVDDAQTLRFLGPARADRQNQFERLLRNAGSWALYGYGTFAVRPHGSAGLIASCGVFRSFRGFGQGFDDVPEAGWIVRRDHWGQGVAVEVMQAVLAWLDESHHLPRIACMIEQGNAASEKIAARLGFARYGLHQPETGAALTLLERLRQID